MEKKRLHGDLRFAIWQRARYLDNSSNLSLKSIVWFQKIWNVVIKLYGLILWCFQSFLFLITSVVWKRAVQQSRPAHLSPGRDLIQSESRPRPKEGQVKTSRNSDSVNMLSFAANEARFRVSVTYSDCALVQRHHSKEQITVQDGKNHKKVQQCCSS